MKTTTTRKSKTSKATKNSGVIDVKITKRGLVRKPVEAKTYRVFNLPVAIWDAVKDSKGEESAHTFINEAVEDHLKDIIASLESLGIQKQKNKRVRMARPTNWQELLDASEYSTIPAQTLLAVCVYHKLNPSIRGK